MKLTDKKLTPRVPERRSTFGKLLFDRGVRDTQSLKRIIDLPRRQWEEDEAFAEQLSAYLRAPGGTMTLRPFQAVALEEIHDFGGAFISGRVGVGKTLISYLAPTLLEAERPLLLIPAKLREKTWREFDALADHWNAPVCVRIFSYEKISRVSGAELLEDFGPDLIIADECHRLKSPKSAVTRRVSRWMGDHPETQFVAMSGTVASRSLRDFAHILRWCLGDKLSPLPTQYGDLNEWCLAVDEKLPPTQFRLPAGALSQLMNEEERANPDVQDGVRCGVRRRIHETPACVMTSSEFLGASLSIDARTDIKYNADVLAAFETLRNDWTTPDGVPFSDPISVWRHARELAQGFWYTWDPAPPPEWMEARRMWASVCRWIIETNRSELDSELQVVHAVSGRCHSCGGTGQSQDFIEPGLGSRAEEYVFPCPLCDGTGKVPGFWADKVPMRDGMPMGALTVGQILAIWREIRPAFKPNTVPVWLDTDPLEQVYFEEDAIYWVGHTAVGRKLSELTRAPYYGQQGRLEAGIGPDVIEEAYGPVIASIAANSEGRNLQRWARQVVLAPPANGKTWEQMLGRTHRDGQEADEVSCTMLMTCEEHATAWAQSLDDASFLESTTGQPQKILRSDVSVKEGPQVWPLFKET